MCERVFMGRGKSLCQGFFCAFVCVSTVDVGLCFCTCVCVYLYCMSMRESADMCFCERDSAHLGVKVCDLLVYHW